MKLPVFKLEKFFETYEFHTRYNLAASDAETLSMQELLSYAQEDTKVLWENLRLGYTPVPGFTPLRKEIQTLYPNVSEKGIATFCGAEEAIFVSLQVLLNPGDHVIIPTPCYQSLQTIAESTQAEVTLLPLKERDGGFVFSIEELEKRIRPTTKLIVLNFPHNPTGATIDRFTLEEIISLAKGVGASIFSDEVYRFSEHRVGASSLPPVASLYEKALSIGVLSKTFGLAGLRTGWIASQDEELVASCLNYKHYLSICNSTPSEILALIALRAKERIIERNLNIVRRNLELLDRFFEKHSKTFAWKRPTAGFTAFVKLKTAMPVEVFVDELISKEGVLLLPGTVYGNSSNCFRIGFGRKDLPEALARLESYVNYRFRDRYDD